MPVTIASIWEVLRDHPKEFWSQSTMVEAVKVAEPVLSATGVTVTPMSSALEPVNVTNGVVMGLVGSGFASEERAAEII